jgi:hypothetical protein
MALDELEAWRSTTTSNIQHASRHNGRLGSRKTRTGCVTCKARRVKCDEGKPFCQRCVSAGRQCDGYPDAMPRTKGLTNAVSLVTPLRLKQHELQTLDYFVSVTAPQLSSSLDSSFWSHQLLQLCHAEPFVLEAVLSISTLHRNPQYLQSFVSSAQIDQHISRSDRVKALKTGDPFGNEKPLGKCNMLSYERLCAVTCAW